MINKFDANNLSNIRKDIDKALAEISKKHGIEIKFGNARYDNNQFKGSLLGVVLGDSAESVVNVSWKQNFIKQATRGNLGHIKPAHFGATVRVGFRELEAVIVGAMARKPEVIVKYKDRDGYFGALVNDIVL